MEDRTIEVGAETLEQAREQLKSQIPEGLYLLSEEVISDGRPKTVKAAADTVDGAFAKAQGELPPGAVILERKEITSPTVKTMSLEAFDERSARTQMESQVGDTVLVRTLKLAMKGKKGFLGIGRRPSRYEAEVVQQAVVEMTYKVGAKLSAKIGRKVVFILVAWPPKSKLGGFFGVPGSEVDSALSSTSMGDLMYESDFRAAKAVIVAAVTSRHCIEQKTEVVAFIKERRVPTGTSVDDYRAFAKVIAKEKNLEDKQYRWELHKYETASVEFPVLAIWIPLNP